MRGNGITGARNVPGFHSGVPMLMVCSCYSATPFNPGIIVTTPPTFKTPSLLLSIAVLLVAMVSIQLGAALAKKLFPLVGASGTTALRLGIGALILLVIWRPWRVRPSRREARMIGVYGLVMGLMNLSFYTSLTRIPLGIAVAVEFTGPLTVAMLASRRAVDFVWILLAVLGLLALLPLGQDARPLDPVGIGLALVAGVCWALYIVVGQKAGLAHGGQTVAIGTAIGALAVLPVGLAQAGLSLFSPSILPLACAVAVLSSALPYSLEMFALTRLPTRTFGVLMSIEPALGALSGLVFLGESLTALQWGAAACIMAASAGSAATSRPAASLP
jgi:inner membrane transporter RhtA